MQTSNERQNLQRQKRDGPPRTNRCVECGRFCGELFTGYSTDSWLKRGRLTCDRCLARQLRPWNQ